MAPCVLMQTSQTVLQSPITFCLLSHCCATLPILTCICTLVCTVPHTHNCSHLLSRSRSHSHSHFTRTSPMPHHQSHSLVLASTLLHNCSRCPCGYIADRTHLFSMYHTCHVTDHICMFVHPQSFFQSLPTILYSHRRYTFVFDNIPSTTSSIAQPPPRSERTSICKFVAPQSRLQFSVEG